MVSMAKKEWEWIFVIKNLIHFLQWEMLFMFHFLSLHETLVKVSILVTMELDLLLGCVQMLSSALEVRMEVNVGNLTGQHCGNL